MKAVPHNMQRPCQHLKLQDCSMILGGPIHFDAWQHKVTHSIAHIMEEIRQIIVRKVNLLGIPIQTATTQSHQAIKSIDKISVIKSVSYSSGIHFFIKKNTNSLHGAHIGAHLPTLSN